MVRSFCAAALVCLMAGAAQAQGAGEATRDAVDWSTAGGDLFGPPLITADTQPDRVLETARLPALSQPYGEAVARAADRHGVDAKLLHALVIVESAYRADAVSPAGAGGLTQLMPGTAADLGVTDRFDVEQNLLGGADYLARQLVRFRDLRLALAAYNAGPARVARLGRIPDIEETRTYVARVVDCYLALTAGRSARSAAECRTPGAVS